MPTPLTDEWIDEQLAICKNVEIDPTKWLEVAVAAHKGYLLVLKELLRLKRVIYSAHEDLMEGESGHAAKTLDDDREPGTKSYYE